jgi:hypothetical protein
MKLEWTDSAIIGQRTGMRMFREYMRLPLLLRAWIAAMATLGMCFFVIAVLSILSMLPQLAILFR